MRTSVFPAAAVLAQGPKLRPLPPLPCMAVPSFSFRSSPGHWRRHRCQMARWRRVKVAGAQITTSLCRPLPLLLQKQTDRRSLADNVGTIRRERMRKLRAKEGGLLPFHLFVKCGESHITSCRPLRCLELERTRCSPPCHSISKQHCTHYCVYWAVKRNWSAKRIG